MTLARAPGKLVVSGAYSVLEGAPAIVAAVDRFAVADSSRTAGFVTEEMRSAFEAPYPWIDARALRDGDRKLGLGSSAALLVAAMATRQDAEVASPDGRDRLFAAALAAHRSAQGGGSGVDVAAAVYGGVLRYQLPEALHATLAGRTAATPRITPLSLPTRTVVEVWSSRTAAKTSDFIRQVYDLRQRRAEVFDRLMQRAWDHADAAVRSCEEGDAEKLTETLAQQTVVLRELGSHAGIPIVDDGCWRLHRLSQQQDGCLIPAGAGGGDVSLFVATNASSEEFRTAAEAIGLDRLSVTLGAPGVTAT